MDVDSMDFNVVIIGCEDIDNLNWYSLLQKCLWKISSPKFLTNTDVGYYF